jgi:GMP synthase-like glutamine amidotransferase
MRAHWLQHVPFEGLGSIGAWLDRAGYRTTRTSFFESADLPDPADIDLLIAMGGPMSVNDEALFPWLAPEKRFIRRAIEAGKPILGVCLGAQLIAAATGASVYPNRAREIGWFPVRGMPPVDAHAFRFPPSIDAFHWHGETFDLPPRAVRLARSEACLCQAFQLGRSVIGLQFHLETTPGSARALVDNCRGEIVPAEFVQGEAELLAASPERYATINALMDEILSYLAGAGGRA